MKEYFIASALLSECVGWEWLARRGWVVRASYPPPSTDICWSPRLCLSLCDLRLHHSELSCHWLIVADLLTFAVRIRIPMKHRSWHTVTARLGAWYGSALEGHFWLHSYCCICISDPLCAGGKQGITGFETLRRDCATGSRSCSDAGVKPALPARGSVFLPPPCLRLGPCDPGS